MHFDPHKPHGIVFNHPHIRYQQNGRDYDFTGRLVGAADEDEPDDAPKAAKPVLEPGQRDFALEQAKEFLKNILAEGPLRRAEIFKVAETNNQPWESVKDAFAAINGEVFNRKNSLYWQLKAE